MRSQFDNQFQGTTVEEESIQSEPGTEQNFFSLDKSFGTQDKEWSQFVFETLKARSTENKVVRLISHVEEL
jgi:DNA repair exonuclease SbcCD ATPase subunit